MPQGIGQGWLNALEGELERGLEGGLDRDLEGDLEDKLEIIAEGTSKAPQHGAKRAG